MIVALVAAVLLFGDHPQARAIRPDAMGSVLDRESGRFGGCGRHARVTCVVDGDTFWYRGEKIRMADINTPEVSSPGCEREARLGAAAARRLTQLLNAGAFTLEPAERDTDRYGRALRVVTRQGASLGLTLEAEGLAERWRGRRGGWC